MKTKRERYLNLLINKKHNKLFTELIWENEKNFISYSISSREWSSLRVLFSLLQKEYMLSDKKFSLWYFLIKGAYRSRMIAVNNFIFIMSNILVAISMKQLTDYEKCVTIYKYMWKREWGKIMIHCNLSMLMGKYRYSIEDIHQRTGLARKTISNLYNDKAMRIDFQTLEKLCAALNCSVEELIILDINEKKMKTILQRW